MRSEKWMNTAIAAVLAFLASLGAVGCFMTGLRLEGDVPTLIVGCAVMAVTFCVCFNTRLALLPVCLSALLIGYWWQEGTLRYAVESMLYRVTTLYDQGYGWGVLQWSEWHLLPDDVTPALLLLALPVVIAVGLTTVKGWVGLLGSAVAMLPLMACLLLKDTVPAEGYLWLLLFAVLMILLTQGVRQRSIPQSNRLSLYLAVPLVVAMALLVALNPKNTYDGQKGAQKLEDFVLRLFEQSEPPELFKDMSLIPGDQDRVVHLENVGKRPETESLIMTVRTQEAGTFYLRGCAYDIYDGTSWSSTPGWNSWSLYYGSNSSQLKTLTVETKQVHSVLYFTYAPFDTERKVVGGRMRNDEDLTKYTVRYKDPIAYDPTLDEKNDEIGGEQLAEYLQLPDSTRERAMKLLQTKIGLPTEKNNAGQTWKNAMIIAQWVSNRAKYDLNTGKMPANQDDFAMWFLEKGKTGYCTHFASAATVLLRAAGIPAQYVTGYLVQVGGSRTATVTSAQAHAWVEVFINGVGWVVLEPTPGFASGGTDIPQPPQVTEPQTGTEPTEPQTGTRPTRPQGTEDSTEPSESQGTETVTDPTGEEPSETVTEPFGHPTATVGQNGGGIGGSGGGGNPKMLGALLWLLGICGGLLAIIAQWRLRVAVQNRRMHKGAPNSRALTRWALIERMAKLTGRAPAQTALQLAQKARFSQHTLTGEELHLLDCILTAQRTLLKRKNFLWQLLYTLILALY